MNETGIIPAADIAAIASAYRDGEPIAKIAHRLGLGPVDVYWALGWARVPIRARGWTKVRPDMDQRIRQLYERGAGLVEIAATFDLAPETVRRRLLAMGVARRTRGGRTR